MKKALSLICAVLILFCSSAAVFADDAPGAVLDARDSVVRILVETPFGAASGTGFAIGSSSPVTKIVTNYHVVEGATKINVFMSRDYLIEATVHTALEASDLAILNVSQPIYDLKPATLNDSVAKEGTKGYALGYPGSADQLSSTLTGNKEDITITDGIVSAITTVPYISGLEPVNAYQINAAINPGNSGGPFVNSKGEVIGINSWGVNDAQGINAAIQVRELTRVLDQNGIPYVKGQSVSIIKIVLAIALLLLLAAIVLLVVILLKKNKKAKGVLTCIQGEFVGQKFYFEPGGITIGRDSSLCNLVLTRENQAVSRSHCNIRFSPESKTFSLTDLASANGTFTGMGTKLTPRVPVTLQPGDKFYLGDKSNTFKVGIEI